MEHIDDNGDIIAVTGINPDGVVCVSILDENGVLSGVEIPSKVMLSIAQDFLFASGFTVIPNREY